MAGYDAIIIGAGHNGLVCANYLAQAGLKVLVLEKRGVIGGAAATEEPFPGYRIDVGSAIHILIHETPIVEDLGLERYGLEYIELDPYAYAAFPDGASLRFYKDVDRTCAEIERLASQDAQAYAEFIAQWLHINDLILPTFHVSPEHAKMGLRAARLRPLLSLPMLMPKHLHQTAELLMTSYGKLLKSTFESEYVRAPLAFMAAQAGPAPHQIGTGNFAGWHALNHTTGVTRPRGGSGALTDALAAALKARGGEVRTGVEVKRIEIASGKVRGVTTADGTPVSARAVVCANPVTSALLGLVDPEHLDSGLRRQLSAVSISNSTGMYVRGAATALPSYTADPGDTARDHHRGLQLMCPSIEYLQKSRDEAQEGRLPEAPAMYVLTPTVVDPSLAPQGKQTLYIWGQYYPYRLADGRSWSDIRGAEAERLVRAVTQYAPNVGDILQESVVRTPQDLADDLSLPNGNIMHLDMNLDQMFFMRPLPALSNYTTPIRGLYLTGAGTHPGGGIQGAPGMNAANVVRSDLKKGKRWVRNAAIAGTAAALAVAVRQSTSGGMGNEE